MLNPTVTVQITRFLYYTVSYFWFRLVFSYCCLLCSICGFLIRSVVRMPMKLFRGKSKWNDILEDDLDML